MNAPNSNISSYLNPCTGGPLRHPAAHQAAGDTATSPGERQCRVWLCRRQRESWPRGAYLFECRSSLAGRGGYGIVGLLNCRVHCIRIQSLWLFDSSRFVNFCAIKKYFHWHIFGKWYWCCAETQLSIGSCEMIRAACIHNRLHFKVVCHLRWGA